MSPHVLVVDADRSPRQQLQECFRVEGFRVTAANNRRTLQHVLDRKHVDLIVLDVQLPGEDGLLLGREVRVRYRTPVILLSTKADEIDRIIGLEIAGDDYLHKPFNPRELVCRARSILRRTLQVSHADLIAGSTVFEFGAWRLYSSRRELVHIDGKHVALTGAEYCLLTRLLIEAPRAVSRACLIERLCGREFDPADRRIDVRISRLRQVLGDRARSPTIIKTLHGRGYAIAMPVGRLTQSR